MFKYFKKEKASECIEQKGKVYAENYINWLTNQTKDFLQELELKKFHAEWGFEVFDSVDILSGQTGFKDGDSFIFDLQPIRIVAFDSASKQMVYITCGKGCYSNFSDSELKYDYVLVPFKDIYNVSVDIDSQTEYETSIKSGQVLKRSVIGELVAGDVGAIIGGSTAKRTTIANETPSKLDFIIQTKNKLCPHIIFSFNAHQKKLISITGLQDTIFSLLSGNDNLFRCSTNKFNRNIGTSIDYKFSRAFNIYKYDGNNPEDYMPVINYIEYTRNLEYIMKRINKYALEIENIIQQNNGNSEQVHAKYDVITELTRLAELKEKGIINEEEFQKLKVEMI